LHTGDRAFARFDNQGAWEAYSKVVALDSSHYHGLWKLVRAYVDVGYGAKGARQEQYYFTAARLARRCVALYPDSVESHFFLAVALGRTALKVGGKKKIALSKEIKQEAERTLALDPKHDGAMHVLGRWNYELANLNWMLRAFAKVLYGGVPPGGNEEAKAWFEKALAIEPNSPAHRLWLGETLIQLKRYEEARAHLQACINLPNLLWDDGINKKQAERALQEIVGKE
jgi:tetratricopeptide (TPR) repeat protein